MRSPGATRSLFIPTHIEHPVSRHSKPLCPTWRLNRRPALATGLRFTTPATTDLPDYRSTFSTYSKLVRASVASPSVWAFPEQQWGRRGGVPPAVGRPLTTFATRRFEPLYRRGLPVRAIVQRPEYLLTPGYGGKDLPFWCGLKVADGRSDGR
jgi:hypothetical protein